MPMIIKVISIHEAHVSSLTKTLREILLCPLCSCLLRYRDSRLRIMKQEGGIQTKIPIRRLKCTGCGRIHTEIPSFLLPYKHYAAEVISGVLDGMIRPEDQDSEDYPSLTTMKRWLRWFTRNLRRIESILQRMLLRQSLPVPAQISSLIRILRTNYPDWLERIIPIIYNNAEELPSNP